MQVLTRIECPSCSRSGVFNQEVDKWVGKNMYQEPALPAAELAIRNSGWIWNR